MSIQTSEQTLPKSARAGRNFCTEVRQYYRTLLRQLDWPGNGSSRVLRTLGVTSCCGAEGVSTIAAQLAATAASWANYQVLLVDANLVRPATQRIFGVSLAPGLVDFLVHETNVGGDGESLPVANEVAVDDDQLAAALQPSTVANLSILAAGRPTGSSAWAYDSADVRILIEKLETRFDLIVFDMPAVDEVSAVTRLASRLDGVLLVIEAERVGADVVRRTSKYLSQANVHLLGAVLNKRRGNASRWL